MKVAMKTRNFVKDRQSRAYYILQLNSNDKNIEQSHYPNIRKVSFYWKRNIRQVVRNFYF